MAGVEGLECLFLVGIHLQVCLGLCPDSTQATSAHVGACQLCCSCISVTLNNGLVVPPHNPDVHAAIVTALVTGFASTAAQHPAPATATAAAAVQGRSLSQHTLGWQLATPLDLQLS